MIQVFITDIQNVAQANSILSTIKAKDAGLEINFDLNETEFHYPCGHTILRIKGNSFNLDNIMEAVKNKGFKCEILEDKICK